MTRFSLPSNQFSGDMKAFSTRVLQIGDRVREIQKQAQALKNADEKVLMQSAIDELLLALEELQVADEELHQQNETLMMTYARLEQEQQHYRSLFEFAPIGYLITDMHGVIQEANYAAVMLLNLNSNFLIKKPFAVFIADMERAYFRQQLIQLHKFQEVLSWQTTVKPRGKAPIEVMLMVVKAENCAPGNAKSPCLRWLIYDLVERKKIELAELEQIFKATFENAGVGIARIGLQGDWLHINRKIQEILGFSLEELAYLSIYQVLHPEEINAFKQGFQKCVSDQVEQHTLENRYVRKDGTVIWGQASLSLVRSMGGLPRYIILVLEDVTQHKLLQEQEKQLAVQKERHHIARELHDAVTQSLFASKLLADTLPNTLKEAPEKMEETLQELKILNDSAVAEMRLLLMELKPNQLLKTRLSTNLNYLISALQGRKRIKVTTSIEDIEAAPKDVQIAFYRIAQEAITNIVKHAKATQVHLSLKSTVTQLMMTIEDNGVGFDVNQVNTGLGIENMRERAEMVHARLTIESGSDGTRIAVLWLSE